MEFKEYGPLAQSKATTEDKKTSWVPLVLMFGVGLVAGIAWSNIVIENQYWNKNK